MDNMNLENKEELQQKLETLRAKDGFICDMDGVIYHGNRLLPGVKEFVDWLYRENKHFLFLTNSSERSPKELQQKLGRMGLDVDESHFYTSALATARFISVHGSVPRFTCIRKDKVTPMLRTASKAMKSLGQKFFFPINPLSKFFIILLFSFYCSMEIFPASYGNCLFSRISAIFLL